MDWFLIALIPPALWAASNHIDKYLLQRYLRGATAGTLMIFSSLIGLFVLPFIYFFQPNVFDISPRNLLIMLANGIIYVLVFLPYFYALQKDETSNVVPLFQVIPVFGYILAYIFLGEVLTGSQVLAALLIILGALGLSLELRPGGLGFRKSVFWLMMLASFFAALAGLLFKYVAIQESFLITLFWSHVGYAIPGPLFFLVAVYRKEFFSVLAKNKIPFLGLNAFNEIITAVGNILWSFAITLAPLALVQAVNGFQPFYVFVFGVLLTIFFPQIAKEKIEKKFLIQKILSIIVIFIGTYFISQ